MATNSRFCVPGLFLLAASAVCCGCQHDHYDVQMTPNGEKVTRQVTVWRQREEEGRTELEEVPAEELMRIAAAYGEDPPAPAKTRHQFVGEFTGKLPNDLGGKGWYVHWDSPLGSTTVYSERVRGDDDFADEVARRQAAAEELADLLVGWAESELKDAEGYESLHRFLDIDLRRDLRNLSLYWWTFTTAADGQRDGVEEALMRMGQYLAERDYFEPQEAPRVVRAVQELSQGDPYSMLRWLQRLAARKMERDAAAPIPESLRFLADPERVKASAARYLKTTDRYRGLMQQWERDAGGDPDLEPPLPTEVLGHIAGEAFPLTIVLGGADELQMRLATPHEPLSTNGLWRESDHTVTWSRSIWSADGDRALPPTVMYALWTEPKPMTQETYFGGVVLDGQRLADYCMWYTGLSKEEAQLWDTFLATMRPGPDLAEKIGTFRFANEPPYEGLQDYEGHAQHAIDLIRQGLNAAQ